MATVLVVDDEELVRDLLYTVLTRLGHTVTLAERGDKAVEVFRRERPHLAILDLHLPDCDGVAILERIRAFDPRLPVIILTGAGTETAERQARDLGVTDFLQKEFSLHSLNEALKRALRDAGQPVPVPTRAHGSFVGRRG